MNGHAGQMDKSSGIYKNYDLFCKLAEMALEEDPELSIERIYDGVEHLTCAMIRLDDQERGQEQISSHTPTTSVSQTTYSPSARLTGTYNFIGQS